MNDRIQHYYVESITTLNTKFYNKVMQKSIMLDIYKVFVITAL